MNTPDNSAGSTLARTKKISGFSRRNSEEAEVVEEEDLAEVVEEVVLEPEIIEIYKFIFYNSYNLFYFLFIYKKIYLLNFNVI